MFRWGRVWGRRETEWNIMTVSGICIPKSPSGLRVQGSLAFMSDIVITSRHPHTPQTLTKGLLLPALLWNRAHKGEISKEMQIQLNKDHFCDTVFCYWHVPTSAWSLFAPCTPLSTLVAQRDPSKALDGLPNGFFKLGKTCNTGLVTPG